ncbi:MAG: hypothetical protein NTV34_01810 [Proteobacteria bacterium]|nr:hypothetical protein [Pseudomonadota bacterium]
MKIFLSTLVCFIAVACSHAEGTASLESGRGASAPQKSEVSIIVDFAASPVDPLQFAKLFAPLKVIPSKVFPMSVSDPKNTMYLITFETSLAAKDVLAQVSKSEGVKKAYLNSTAHPTPRAGVGN